MCIFSFPMSICIPISLCSFSISIVNANPHMPSALQPIGSWFSRIASFLALLSELIKVSILPVSADIPTPHPSCFPRKLMLYFLPLLPYQTSTKIFFPIFLILSLGPNNNKNIVNTFPSVRHCSKCLHIMDQLIFSPHNNIANKDSLSPLSSCSGNSTEWSNHQPTITQLVSGRVDTTTLALVPILPIIREGAEDMFGKPACPMLLSLKLLTFPR